MKPSLREKERYCVIKVDADGKEVQKEIDRCIRLFIGLLGSAEANVKFLKECWEKPFGIVKVSNRYVSHFKASLGFSNLVFDVPYTTGMIKKAKIFIRSSKG
jgi:RNase P/RNase MRP subunit POP5